MHGCLLWCVVVCRCMSLSVVCGCLLLSVVVCYWLGHSFVSSLKLLLCLSLLLVLVL